jgi:hypothetical protein
VRGARVSLGIALQKKLSVGFFGGEGFIMQKLEGDGLAFVHAGGTVVKRDLQPGQVLMVDTGCVVAYTQSINFEIQYVGKIKTAMFGGEGLFFARITGPGTVWLQSLPFSRLASRVFAAAPQAGGGRSEQSSAGRSGGGRHHAGRHSVGGRRVNVALQGLHSPPSAGCGRHGAAAPCARAGSRRGRSLC